MCYQISLTLYAHMYRLNLLEANFNTFQHRRNSFTYKRSWYDLLKLHFKIWVFLCYLTLITYWSFLLHNTADSRSAQIALSVTINCIYMLQIVIQKLQWSYAIHMYVRKHLIKSGRATWTTIPFKANIKIPCQYTGMWWGYSHFLCAEWKYKLVEMES